MKATLLLIICLVPGLLIAQRGIQVPAMKHADSLVEVFRTTYNLPGVSMAIARNGKLIYDRSYGFTNAARTDTLMPYGLFRVASVSKPITSIAIMKLVEMGLVSLSAKPFAQGGYLDRNYYSVLITDDRIRDITVQHLLEHAAGWNRDLACYGFPSCDPIGFPLYVTQQMSEPNPVGDSTLIRFLLRKGLDFAPGTAHAYSNIGYLVLGKIIEKVTGQAYEDWVRTNLLLPAGAHDGHLGFNLKANRQEREVEYVAGFTTQSCYGTGQLVPWQYGGWNLEAMSAHGGWIFSARDLVRLGLSVDGFSTRPDVLSPSSIQAMVRPSTTNPYYAKGWQVNSLNNWWHGGSLDGTSAYMVRSSGGFVWAILVNARLNSNAYWNAIDNLGWDCIANVANWPAHDLFPPADNASNITVAPLGNGSVRLKFSKGNGDKRLVTIKSEASPFAFPKDGRTYAGNAAYGTGPELGPSNYIVSADTATSIIVTGLTTGQRYHARVLEYSQNTATGNNAIYLLGDNPTVIFTTQGIVVATKPSQLSGLSVLPNPARNGQVELRLNGRLKQETLTIRILDQSGHTVHSGSSPADETIKLNIPGVRAGLYLVQVSGKHWMRMEKVAVE